MKIALVIAVLICLIAVGSSSALRDPDLIFYFTYENAEGGVVPDQSGKGHDGKINGKITIVDGGKRGKAAEFATTSFIDMNGPSIPPEQIPTDAITICAWAKCKNTGDHHAIFNARASDATWLIHPEFRGAGEDNFRWLLRSDGGATIFDIRAGKVQWDTWTHYAGTYDGKKGTLYINGEQIAEAPGGAKIAKDWGSGARVGYNIDNARPFTGLMDDLCLWKRCLTLDEIKIVMENGPEGLPGEAVSPVGSLTITWGRLKVF